MQSETAISRELMGKIVDEVFDGAIEDPSVIEEIYAVIKREEANLSKVDERKPLDLNITQDWFEKRAALEGDHEIGAGPNKFRSCVNPTQDELAELFKIAHRIPDGWQLVPIAALSAAEPVAIYKGNGLIDCGESGHHNIELLKLIPANTPLYTVAAYPLSSSAQIDAIRNWSDQKFGEPFSISACHDLLSALSAQVQDVAGWQLVPFKMTAAMINAWSGGKTVSTDENAYHTTFQDAWARVLAAAPAKQEGGTNE